MQLRGGRLNYIEAPVTHESCSVVPGPLFEVSIARGNGGWRKRQRGCFLSRLLPLQQADYFPCQLAVLYKSIPQGASHTQNSERQVDAAGAHTLCYCCLLGPSSVIHGLKSVARISSLTLDRK